MTDNINDGSISNTKLKQSSSPYDGLDQHRLVEPAGADCLKPLARVKVHQILEMFFWSTRTDTGFTQIPITRADSDSSLTRGTSDRTRRVPMPASTRLEVVLPSLQDVRHRQAAAAAAAAAALQDLPVPVAPVSSTDHVMKSESDEDGQRPFALPRSLDTRDPQILHSAIEEMRNVSL